MDAGIRVPGTRLRFGLDPILGLIPGVGDTAGAVLASWIFVEAARRGASRETLTRIAANIALDACIGAIPGLGDVFDFTWKANLRNVALLERQLADPHAARRADRRFIVLLGAGPGGADRGARDRGWGARGVAAAGRWWRLSRKARWFWPLALALLVADCATKRAAEASLALGTPEPVVGDVVRLTLSYNRAAAMGIGLGSNARPILAGLSIAALALLAALYYRTGPGDRRRAVGVALLVGGAVGNLIDRVRSSAGVVDFIDLGIGHQRFWTFNLADVGITAGAIVLLVVFGRWGQERGGGSGGGLSRLPPAG